MPEEKFVNLTGVKLQTLDWGGVGRPLVLLTGLGATARYYESLAPKLAARFKVTGLTRRAHGRSDRPATGYDLDTLVEDIRGFMDAVGIKRAVLVGHSLAGFEMALFAKRYPLQVEAIVYLDAIYPKLDPEPDLSGDPLDALPQSDPTEADFASVEAYLAYWKRGRPDWAGIWGEAIEQDLLENVRIQADGRVEELTDFGLFGQIWKTIEPQTPDYGAIQCPMLAIMPAGHHHPSVPLDASDELRKEADRYWKEKCLPSVRERIKAFRQVAPGCRVLELDSSNHRIFMSKEKETVQAIFDFLPG
jgi:pimeloyl-ACP methyl ester carboxylesterase